MISLEDCIELCGLSEEEVLAIVQHEHIPEIAAAEMANYLVSTPSGKVSIREMIRDDIAKAEGAGDRARTLALKLLLRKFIVEHPACEARHLQQMRYPDRRLNEKAGP